MQEQEWGSTGFGIAAAWLLSNEQAQQFADACERQGVDVTEQAQRLLMEYAETHNPLLPEEVRDTRGTFLRALPTVQS